MVLYVLNDLSTHYIAFLFKQQNEPTLLLILKFDPLHKNTFPQNTYTAHFTRKTNINLNDKTNRNIFNWKSTYVYKKKWESKFKSDQELLYPNKHVFLMTPL